MKAAQEPKQRRSGRTSSSPARTRPSRPHDSNLNRLSPSASFVDRELVTREDTISTSLKNLEISSDYPVSNPRSFSYNVKQQCWEKAEQVKGRDPDRWRRDPLGNLVFRKLVGCTGCLCHDYDHIFPYSKGGKSTLENCQVLQAKANRSKSNKTDISRAELIQKSSYCRVSGRDMDLLEVSAYGNVTRGNDSGGGCRIQ